MSILFLYIIHHIVLSLGLASSLIVDIFIIMVEKTKKIRSVEKNIVNRILSYSFIFSLFIFLIQLTYFFFIFENQEKYNIATYLFSGITFILSSLLLFFTATQKYYQFKILYRYQEQHGHLSDSFISHHKELKYTSITTFINWLLLYISWVLI